MCDPTYLLAFRFQTPYCGLGRGLQELCFGDAKNVDITTLDLGPALGSVGGVCVGKQEVIEHQRLSGAGYCFSAAAPPFVSTAAIAALELLQSEGGTLLPKLAANADALRAKLVLALQGSKLRVHSPRSLASVPFTLVALAQPSADPAVDFAALQDIVDAVAENGFALAVCALGPCKAL